MNTDETYNNSSKKDVFGVRRPTNQEDIEPLGWKVIDPNLDTAFAEITTVTAIMQGVVTYDFMQHANSATSFRGHWYQNGPGLANRIGRR